MVDWPPYVFQKLREDGEMAVFRGKRPDDGSSVLLVAAASERPSPSSINRIRHAYSLRDELDSAWAICPLDLLDRHGIPALVLQDPGGDFLDEVLRRSPSLEELLRLAIAITRALGGLHARQLIHRDVKPANVVANAATGIVWLTGFGLTSRLPRCRQLPDPPDVIAGTLAYMPPEQTGRMNRSIDSRSDLYSLGVTLYEMFVGVLPFEASDPMGWVHCHIARVPEAPSLRRSGIPEPLSAIILKLLAKTPEERYQTAAGVEADLRRILSAMETCSPIESFPLGTRDVPPRLLIPEKLYGREREVRQLLAAFDRVVRQGAMELMLVSGYSGVGKSSVVNELHKVLVPPRGLFAAGKFDQYKRDIPYATLAQAFGSLIRQILAQSETSIAAWRSSLQQSLGTNGQLMINLIPELELVIGKQLPVVDLPPQDAQNRFHNVLQRLIDAFARPEHPLALFLDDLQWLDAATLHFLEYLITNDEVRNLLLIGAYRDNEVGTAHPLMLALAQIRKAGARIHQITLAPLSVDDVSQLVADALHCERHRAHSLAQAVHEKTGGNPFFSIQFIMELEEEGLLILRPEPAVWVWDAERISAKGFTDNVVGLMVAKLNRLPEPTQGALKQLACLGNSAAFEMLRRVYQNSNDTMHEQLEDAVRAGLLFRSDNSYHFLHDRVQEAAYSLIPQELKARTHLQIGNLLAESTPQTQLEESIFDIVNQLNRASHLITSEPDRARVASLNLIAGRRARASTAYASALKFLDAGRSLLTEATWERNYQLIFAIERLIAECELLTAEMSAAEKRLAILARRAATRHDLSIVTRLQLTLYTTLDRSDLAIEVFLDYLKLGGTEWSKHPTHDEVMAEYHRIGSQVGSRPIEDLVNLPLMMDPDVIDMVDVLTEMVHAALFYDENLSSLVVCRMVSLSLEHGNCDGSCFAYVWFGMFSGPRFNNYKEGFRFGQLGYDLVEKRQLTRHQARTYISFSTLMPWAKHALNARALVRRAFDVAYRTGDLTFSAYSWHVLITNYLTVGDDLADVQTEAETGLAFTTKAGFGLVADNCRAQLGLIRTLRGLTPRLGCFDDGNYNESETEAHLAGNPGLVIAEFFYWTRKLQARFFAGDYPSAVDAAETAGRLLWTASSQVETGDFRFFAALAHAAAWNSASAEDRPRHFDKLMGHYRQLEIWAGCCPANFENRTALVGAEIARIENLLLDAESLYEKAILSARANGFPHNEAIASEAAARFYAGRGFARIADVYLQDALTCYLRWGADGKARQLEQSYPRLKAGKRGSDSLNTMEGSLQHLDLATVIKVSQAVSGEIELGKLINTLMRTAIEHAGAQRGILILPRGGDYRIEAEATVGTEAVDVVMRQVSVSGAELPESVFQYVVRTKESVLLHNASGEGPFTADNYIHRHRAHSVLCLPLLKQARLLGILYLENNLATHVFTPEKTAVLKLLASQAAISLENTRLYGDLQEREARISRLFNANIMGIFTWNLDGRILEANEAFAQIVGYQTDELMSGNVRWKDLMPAEWNENDDQIMTTLLATGIAPSFEAEYVQKDGSRVPVLVGAALFEGAPTEGVAFVLDLTGRKRAEANLRRSETFLAEAQKLSLTGSFGWNVSADEHFWSDETFRIFEFDPSTPISLHRIRQRVHPQDFPLMDQALALAAQGKPLDYECRLLMPGGAVKYVHIVGHSIRDKADRYEYVGAVQDVTERRLSEETLGKVRSELAHAARIATLGVLTASIAHEVRQPLSGIITNAGTCLRMLSAEPPNIQGALETARRTIRDGHRASDVITHLRALSTKKGENFESVNLTEAAREVIALLQSELQRKQVVLRTELADELPSIQGDRVQLQQVILNLLLNASDAMSELLDRPRQLVIRTRRAENQHVQLSVEDAGTGVDPQIADKLFEAFYTTKRDGMGIGLSVSRSIIENHHGRIWAAPNAGPGATFSFSIPCKSET